MKAIGYCRVSTIEQAAEGISMDAQEAKVRAWADFHEASAVLIFRDEGISGKRADNRPGLQEAMAMVGRGDALVCYSLSRLSRSTKDTIAISETLQRKGADLVSTSENIDTTTAAGNMFFQIMAVLAEFERKQTGERTRMALQFKKKNGELVGSVPYGKRLAADRVKLEDDREEAETISMIKRMRRSGASYRRICARLTRLERKCRGGKWHPQTIKNIMDGVITVKSHPALDKKAR
ncbi:MAG: recombinase family protein [Candidatus Omnitrophica bacterium]|nr:recombinase family protein [Candidatus Omnitrophota bacterium]